MSGKFDALMKSLYVASEDTIWLESHFLSPGPMFKIFVCELESECAYGSIGFHFPQSG